MSESDIPVEWLQATLADAADALSETLAKLEDHPDTETAEEILRRDLVNVYAKLNYAVNSSHLGPEALNVLSEDELIAWPAAMPFLTLEEIEREGLEGAADDKEN